MAARESSRGPASAAKGSSTNRTMADARTIFTWDASIHLQDFIIKSVIGIQDAAPAMTLVDQHMIAGWRLAPRGAMGVVGRLPPCGAVRQSDGKAMLFVEMIGHHLRLAAQFVTRHQAFEKTGLGWR